MFNDGFIYKHVYRHIFIGQNNVSCKSFREKRNTLPYFLEIFTVLEIIRQIIYYKNTFEFYNSTIYSDFLNSIAIEK
jgi:hypothetical protein